MTAAVQGNLVLNLARIPVDAALAASVTGHGLPAWALLGLQGHGQGASWCCKGSNLLSHLLKLRHVLVL